MARDDLLEQGRDLGELRRFADATRPTWERDLCARCLGVPTGRLCRRHLIAALRRGETVDLRVELAFLADLRARLDRYARSFRWEERGTDRPEDRAALLAAVGWCSGWSRWPQLIDERDLDRLGERHDAGHLR